MTEGTASSRVGPTYALESRSQKGKGELASHPGKCVAVGLIPFLASIEASHL